VARYLKEQDPSVKVIAVDVEGSIFSDYFHKGELTRPGPYLLEGLGDEELIKCPEFELIDDMLQVSDRDSFLYTRRLAAEEAIMAGGSSGAALWGVTRLIQRLDGPARIVTVFPDGAARYLTKIFDDDWMRRNGFLD
jgi:cystathionine beta-synthase